MKPVFIDEADIVVESGSGGGGSVHFHRARFLPKGGPDGGDGGRGGNVIIFARENLSDLSSYLHKKSFKAESGAPGGGNKQHGKSGADLRLAVPVGTQVFEGETQELLGDLISPGAELVVAMGGKGGRGNVHYKNSVRQAPRIAQPGLPGQRVSLHLVYKMITDVGLIGPANSGKSVFLSRITSAKPRIASYPHTTTIPQLGVYLPPPPASPLTFVEIPAIEAEGTKRGNRYLKHVERAKLLLMLLGVSPDREREEIFREADTILGELKGYGETLAEKPKILVLNCFEGFMEAGEITPLVEELKDKTGLQSMVISAVTGEGVTALLKVVEGFCTLGHHDA